MDPISEVLLIIQIAAKAEPIAAKVIQDGTALLQAWRSGGADPTADQIAELRSAVQADIQQGDSLMPKGTA